jgi:ribosome biogenesis GTPase A
VDESRKLSDILCEIAENRNCISKGGELDYSKAAALLIDEFRSGKLGKITLELPDSSQGEEHE